ncbi:cytosine permease [Williamsia sp. 1135]|uniref:purine-cytosine permease family protein n=1 Tax=Williamsia sp. 1135 TaxID=1889262 RepID=UPI000A10CDC4|nr:cytosine permease [Williamsia sp. 1135]ORM36200.1 allantoin permease [Williamsia sp. 1135]
MTEQTRDRVGVIETRGIEPIPDSERHGKPIGLFWMWFGANMGVLGITLGAALITFQGLNVAQAILVAVIGSVGSFLLVGLLSIAGKRGGAPGLTLSRAVFGVRGNWAPTLVAWLGFVGWETVMCTTAAFALLALLDLAGVAASVPLTVVCVLVTVVLAAVIGLFGHATIMWVQKWLTWVFGGLTVVVVVFLAVTVDWAAAFDQTGGPMSSVVAGVGFIAAGTGLGWLAAGADYARYLPRQVQSRRIVGSTVFGAAVPLVALVTMGALMAVGDADLASSNDPVAAVGNALPSWMLVPYLLTAVFGLIAGADLSMYSSGLNLITGGIKVKRTTAVAVDALLITVGGLYITVIADDFYGPFTTFLTLLAVPLTAWAAVFLVDLAGRHHYDEPGLMNTSGPGPYWYRGGVRWTALIAWAAAIVLGLLFTHTQSGDTVWFAGPLSDTWVGQNSLGWFVSGLSAALLFLVLRRIAGEESVFRAPAVVTQTADTEAITSEPVVNP